MNALTHLLRAEVGSNSGYEHLMAIYSNSADVKYFWVVLSSVILGIASDFHVKLHDASLVIFVDPSRWRPWFKEKGSRNVSSVCFQPFVEQRAPSRGLNRHN